MVLAWDEVPAWDGSKGPCEASRDWAGSLRDLTSTASRGHAGTGSAGGGSGGSGPDPEPHCEFDLTKIAARDASRDAALRPCSRGEPGFHGLREHSLPLGAPALQRHPGPTMDSSQPNMAKALHTALEVRRRAAGMLRLTRNSQIRTLREAWRSWILAHTHDKHLQDVLEGAERPAKRLLLVGALRHWRMQASRAAGKPVRGVQSDYNFPDHEPCRETFISLHKEAQEPSNITRKGQDAHVAARVAAGCLNGPVGTRRPCGMWGSQTLASVARGQGDFKLQSEHVAMLLARRRLGLMLCSWSSWTAFVEECVDDQPGPVHGERDQRTSHLALSSAVRDWFNITKSRRSRRLQYFWAYRLCIKHLVSEPFFSWHCFAMQSKRLRHPAAQSRHAVLDHQEDLIFPECPPRNRDDCTAQAGQLNRTPASRNCWGTRLETASGTDSEGEHLPESLDLHAAVTTRPCPGVMRASRPLAASNSSAPACPDLVCARGRFGEDVTFAVPGSDTDAGRFDSSCVSASLLAAQTLESRSCKTRQQLPASPSCARSAGPWQTPVKEFAALAHCDPAILDPRWWDAAAEALCRDVGGSPALLSPMGRIDRHQGQHAGFVELPFDRQICFESEASCEAVPRMVSAHSDAWKCRSPSQAGQADSDTRSGPFADSRRGQTFGFERVDSPARGRRGDLSLEVPTQHVDRSASPSRARAAGDSPARGRHFDSPGQVAGDLSLEAPELRPDRPSTRACAVVRPCDARSPRAEHSLTTPATPFSAEILRDYSQFEVARLRPRRPASTGIAKRNRQSPSRGGDSAQGNVRRAGPVPSFSKAGLPISTAARWAMTSGNVSLAGDGTNLVSALAERDALAAENVQLRRLLQAEEAHRPRTPPKARARAFSAKPLRSGKTCDDKPVRQQRRGFR